MVENYGQCQSKQREEHGQEHGDWPEHGVLRGESWMINTGQIMKDFVRHGKGTEELGLDSV